MARARTKARPRARGQAHGSSGATAAASPAAPARGRPRSLKADAAIYRATLELLPVRGFRALNMEAVAARARVSKATLYRRFASKYELVAAALQTIRSAKPAPDTGSSLGDVRKLVRRELDVADDVPQFSRLTASLLSDVLAEPEMRSIAQETVLATDYAMLGQLVDRAVKRGEFRPDLDVAAATQLLHAVIIYRFLTQGGRADAVAGKDFERLMETLARGLAGEKGA